MLSEGSRAFGVQAGWGKELTYVVAFNKDGVTDVMRRYTRLWPKVQERRKMSSEAWFALQIDKLKAKTREDCSAEELLSLQAADAAEAEELAAMQTQTLSPADLALPGVHSLAGTPHQTIIARHCNKSGSHCRPAHGSLCPSLLSKLFQTSMRSFPLPNHGGPVHDGPVRGKTGALHGHAQ